MKPSRRSRSRWIVVLELLVVLLVVSSTAVGTAYAEPTQADRLNAGTDEVNNRQEFSSSQGIAHVDFNGTGVATREDIVTYVWQDGHTVLRTTVFPLANSGNHDICLELVRDNSTVHDHGCKSRDVANHGARVEFNMQKLGTNETGQHELVLTLKDGSTNDTVRTPINVITRNGDIDSDQLSNEQEVERGTSINTSDTDADGLSDGAEVHEYNSDPMQADTDGDGLRDGQEINFGSDPSVPHSDNDSLTDKEEYDIGTDPKDPDTDDDGVPDGEEVEAGTNPAGTPTPTVTNTTTATPAEEGMSWFSGLLIGLGALLLFGFAVVVYTRFDGISRDGNGAVGSESVDATGGSDDPREALEAIDPELLSPEQYVDQLLEAYGGQMKQSEIVEQTDWSKAKVSRTLKGMEEEGTIERTRIGRGNVVSYPGKEPGNDL